MLGQNHVDAQRCKKSGEKNLLSRQTRQREKIPFKNTPFPVSSQSFLDLLLELSTDPYDRYDGSLSLKVKQYNDHMTGIDRNRSHDRNRQESIT